MFPSISREQRSTTARAAGMLGLLLAVTTTFSAPLPAIYPRIELTPAQPTSSDITTLRLVRGIASSSCGVPTYTDVSCTITLIDTPFSTIDLHYTEVPPPPDLVCTAEYNPTEYGPTFTLDTLPAGFYVVRDEGVPLDTITIAAKIPGRITIDGTVAENTGPLDVVRVISGAKVYLSEIMDIMPLKSTSSADMMPTRVVDSAITDAMGQFAFTDVPVDQYTLSFSSSEHQGDWLWLSPQQDTTLFVELLPIGATGDVTGTITAACPPNARCLWLQPLEGCTVTVSIAMIMYKSTVGVPYSEYIAITDRDGHYTIADIPITSHDAVYAIHARMPGYHDTTATLELAYGFVETMDLSLRSISLGAISNGVSTTQSDKVVSLDRSHNRLMLDLPQADEVRVEVFNTRGQKLADLTRNLGAGRQTIELTKAGLRPHAVAFLRVRGEGFSEIVRLSRTARTIDR